MHPIDLTFKGVKPLRTTVVALTHPAQRHLNVGSRVYRGYSGYEAELVMLNETPVVAKSKRLV